MPVVGSQKRVQRSQAEEELANAVASITLEEPMTKKPRREDVSDEEIQLLLEDYQPVAEDFFPEEPLGSSHLFGAREPLNEAEKIDEKDLPASWMRCPFHDVELDVLHEQEDEVWKYRCPFNTCPVFCTNETVTDVLPELKENTHPEMRAKICVFDDLQCKCGSVPFMKLSRTQKNPNRVFLTCGQPSREEEDCGYFQWMDAPLRKPKRIQPRWKSQGEYRRPVQPSQPRWKTVETPQGEYFADGQRGREYKGRRYVPEMSRENRARLYQKWNEKKWMSEFAQSAARQTKHSEESFKQACDRINEQRKQHNCAPYDYETYRKFGLGIF